MTVCSIYHFFIYLYSKNLQNFLFWLLEYMVHCRAYSIAGPLFDHCVESINPPYPSLIIPDSSHPLKSSILLPISMTPEVSGSAHKWDHNMSVFFLCLSDFSWHRIHFHSVTHGKFAFVYFWDCNTITTFLPSLFPLQIIPCIFCFIRLLTQK